MILRGDRVVLRPFRPEELEVVYQARQGSTGAIATLDRAAFQRRFSRSGDWYDDRLDLAVEAGGELVGEVGARRGSRMLPVGVCELGIHLWQDRRGAGIGTDTIALLTGWLHEHGFPRVQGSTDVRNGPMQRVFEKTGYVCEGTLRSFMPDPAGRADYLLYAHVA